jgi:hypothetical protein
MTTMGYLAVEMIIELLQIVIESDDEAVASDAESISLCMKMTKLSRGNGWDWNS